MEVLGVVLEVRAVAVGGLQGAPVAVNPVLAVVNFNVGGADFLGAVAVNYGDGEGLDALGGADEAAVAVGLLVVVLVDVKQQRIGREQLAEEGGWAANIALRIKQARRNW